MNSRVTAPAKAIRYFMDRVRIDDIDACWFWQRSTGSHGYGQLFWDNKVQTAHRFAYHLFCGDPGNAQINHRCGNRKCCNPAHLYAGTQLDNFRDMVNHGTHVPPPHKQGSAVGNSKLTEAEAAEIKRCLAKGVAGAQLARQFNVSASTISLIRKGIRWRHVSS